MFSKAGLQPDDKMKEPPKLCRAWWSVFILQNVSIQLLLLPRWLVRLRGISSKFI